MENETHSTQSAAQSPQECSATATHAEKKRKPWCRRMLKACCWIVGSLVGLVLLLMCLAAWILTPERLTPLVEKYGSQYLKADVKAKRVELTIWSSFPSIQLDITDLELTSRTLQGQPDSILQALGPDANHLLSAHTLSGSINPWKLMGGTIDLGNMTATGLGVNVVSYNETINNYDILPTSEEEEEEGTPWKLRFGTIHVKAEQGIRYFDAASGVDLFLNSPELKITPKDDECKQLMTTLNSDITLKYEGEQYLNNWPLSTKGLVQWDFNTLDFDLPDYSISLALFSGTLKAHLSMDDPMVLHQCELIIDPINLSNLLRLLPEDMMAEYPLLKGIDTDMRLQASLSVSCPWNFNAPDLPDVNINFSVPSCHFTLNDDNTTLLCLDNIEVDGSLLYNGSTPEASSLSISRFDVAGNGLELNMSASAEELLSDNPLITFSSRGTLNLKSIASLLPYSGSLLTGNMEADAELRCRLNDMLELKYENIDANGSLLIRDFVCTIPQLATRMYSHLAEFEFGNAIDNMGPRVPNTLLARASIDTLYYAMPGMELAMNDASLKAGASTSVITKKENSKEITPMGMSFTASRFKMDSQVDTTKVRVNDLKADGSITRYEGNAESPLLKAALSANGLLYSDPTMRIGMKQFTSDLTAHLRKRNHGNKRRSKSTQKANTENMFTVDVENGVKSLFKRWGISGNLSSAKMRVTHLLYPVPVTVTDLNFDFSLDSVRLHKAHITTQDNSMTLAGTISNIRQLVLGRTRKPLTMRLFGNVDSININQVAYNFTLGSALESQRGRLARLSEEEQDAIVKAAAAIDTVESLASDSIPMILPRNIDAIIKLKADKALYGDINLYKLRTDLVVNDGAASIDSLQASTDFGNAYLNLLYSSRNPQLLNLAVDLGFSDINLQDLYSTFPTIAEMAPAITNLSGMVGAKLVGSFDMYPNMDIDINSLSAVLNITGNNLELSQSPLIRKVARMMLIRKNGPLQISDMNIQLSLHDNVMRLFPFQFGMEKYRFALLGQNDLSENMYYHLSVLKSPIPFKFGINVKGTFDKPKIRFGGAKYKENEALAMVNLVETQRINFVKAMRLELRKLINKAAVTYADRPEYNQFGQNDEMHISTDTTEDDSQFESPIDMLGASLRSSTVKTFGKSRDKLLEFSKTISTDDEEKSQKKKKKK